MQDRHTTFLPIGCSVRDPSGFTARERIAALATQNLAYLVLKTVPDCKWNFRPSGKFLPEELRHYPSEFVESSPSASSFSPRSLSADSNQSTPLAAVTA